MTDLQLAFLIKICADFYLCFFSVVFLLQVLKRTSLSSETQENAVLPNGRYPCGHACKVRSTQSEERGRSLIATNCIGQDDMRTSLVCVHVFHPQVLSLLHGLNCLAAEKGSSSPVVVVRNWSRYLRMSVLHLRSKLRQLYRRRQRKNTKDLRA